MTTPTIDQTASELRLHHALYIVTLLRAMLIHVPLALIAVALFFFVHIDGVYPLANAAIHSVKAQLGMENNLLAPGFVVVGGSITVVLMLAFFLWMYLSITNVWRVGLKLQAATIVIFMLVGFSVDWPQLKFAYEHLSILFTGLATVFYGLRTIVALDIGIALWSVARSPERSSFVATLDPRLAPNMWTYLNKLLDLPRTPLQSWRTVAAYMLSLAGAVLLIASGMYLFFVGAVYNKLAEVFAEWRPTNIANCAEQSSVWAQQTLPLLGVAFIGMRAAVLMQTVAKRLGGLSISDVLKNPGDRFVLYLRPFDTDAIILPKPRLPLFSKLLSFRPFPVRIEEELFDVADGYRPLIAVGKPGMLQSKSGGLAHRVFLEDSEWQDYVLDKIRCADRIVIVLKDTVGVRWELARIIGEGAALKTLFFFHPVAKDPEAWRTLAKKIVPPFEAAELIEHGFEFHGRPIGFFFHNGDLTEIANANWTATSYRTAFSNFLAEEQEVGLPPQGELQTKHDADAEKSAKEQKGAASKPRRRRRTVVAAGLACAVLIPLALLSFEFCRVIIARNHAKEAREQGDVFLAEGKRPEALDAYRQSLAILKRLADQHKDQRGWESAFQWDLSVSYIKVGNVLLAQGQLPEALNACQQGLAIARLVANPYKSNGSFQLDLSWIYERLGDVLKVQGKLPEALDAYRQSLNIKRTLVDQDKSNSGWQRDLVVSYVTVGDVLKTQGKLPEALDAYQQARVIAKSLAEKDKSNTGWQRDLTVSYQKISSVLVAQRKFPEALDIYQQSLSIRKTLADQDTANTGWQWDLSSTYENVGEVLPKASCRKRRECTSKPC